MKKRLLLLACTAALTATAAAQETTRQSVLQGGRNLVVTTTRGATYYYFVSSNEMPVMHLGDGTVRIAGDEFQRTAIKGIRFRTLPRAVLNEDSTSFNRATTLDHTLLALRRTLNVGRWNSLVLPFDLTGRQLLDAFGEGAEVATPRAINEDGETTVEFETMDLQTDDVVTKANYHYLLRPTREPDVDAGTRLYNYVSGQLYGPIYLIPNVSMKANQNARLQTVQSADGTKKVRFRGTYLRLDDSDVSGRIIRNRRVAPGMYMMTDEGLMAQTEDSTVVSAFRSWIEDVSEDTSAPLRFYVDGVCEDISTGIGAVGEEDSGTAEDGQLPTGGGRPCFDLAGRKLSEGAMRKGIYIVGGRKVAIK